MNTQTQSSAYQPPVSQLLTLGEDAARGVEWFDYLSLGFSDNDIPELLRMALDEDLFWAETESASVWAPIHAWRTLAQLKTEAAIEPLLELLSYIDDGEDGWSTNDFPMIYAMIGPAAIPVLKKQLMDNPYNEWVGATLSNSLEKIAQYHPDYRDECVAIITEKLRHHHENDIVLNGLIISDLLDLQAVESAAEIEAAYRANNVDLSICGDWEDAQITLRLLAKRLTPKPNYALQQIANDAEESLQGIRNLGAVNEEQKTRTLADKKERQQKAKSKKKRKQAKAQRKKQRKKK